jgi:short subunit dehydrogenase-like uncharacterized protein
MDVARELDLVLLGATGYTGRLCAEYIAQHFPRDMKWAFAGRSAEKLENMVRNLKSLNPSCVEPGTSYFLALIFLKL